MSFVRRGAQGVYRKLSSLRQAEFPPHVLNCAETRVTTLRNGLRVASETHHGHTASIGVWIDAGSRYETAENNGAAHFLEHMAFKGTKRRSQMEMEVMIENMGAHLNAYTSREQTVYFAKVFEKDVDGAMEVLSDILQNSNLAADAVTRERDVILREMEEVNKQQEEVILDYLHEAAFQGTGLGRTILGPAENVRSLTREQLRNYIDTHYTAKRMVIAGAGAVEHEELVELADKYWGHLPSEAPPGAIVTHDDAKFTGSEKRVLRNAEEKGYMAISFRGASWTDDLAFPLMVMQSILGAWDRVFGGTITSPMAQELVSRGLCHSYNTFNTCYKDVGLFGLYATADDQTLEPMVEVMLKHMADMHHSITDEQVEKAKVQLKSSMIMQLDSFSNMCEDMGRQMLTYGRRMTPAELFARIDAIDTEDVRLCARYYINDEDPAISAIGQISSLPEYNWIRQRTVGN